jgi:electron-transferring-flavoprotein dehydrogenase
VIGLDYQNPYINPYKEFQRWKTHPEIKKHFEGGTCISYGARVLNEGGYHSIPKLTFKGGALIGCSAGFLNSVKIKGTHTAIKSGIVAAESIFSTIQKSSDSIKPVSEIGEIDENEEIEVTEYEDNMKKSWVNDELFEVRNAHAAFAKYGFLPGLAYSGLVAHVLKGREPWTFEHNIRDADTTMEAKHFDTISYPNPDGVLTFDLLTNLQRSGTYHNDDQESHLRIKEDLSYIPESVSMQKYAAPEQRFCPAGVYEYVSEDGKDPKLVINAQNCVHCKCCSIKMPGEYINWTVPEGGGGPQYQIM